MCVTTSSTVWLAWRGTSKVWNAPFRAAPPDRDIEHGVGRHRSRHRCMPHRLTVRASMKRKITDSTRSPIRMTVSSPENTVAVSRSLRASKMYQPMPPERADTPNTNSAATNVRQWMYDILNRNRTM